MKFDVIIGNPPYQLSSNSSGIQATPIYDKFVQQSKKLNPLYLTLIIPSRWFSGGMGLNSFRDEMLNDMRIRRLVDYPKSRECFEGVDIAGGVCYFLWDRKNIGDCLLTSICKGKILSKKRKLNEFDIFIRDNIGIEIIHKVPHLANLSSMVFPISPFGIDTKVRGTETKFDNCIKLISSSGCSFISKERVIKNKECINKYKVIIGQLNPDRGGVNNSSDGKMNVTTKINLLHPNEVHTATYLLLGTFSTEKEALNYISYIKTMFVRYLLSLTLSSMHITRDSFRFIPQQNFNEPWTDEKLYKKYGLTQEEIDFIESMVRPME